MDRGAWYATVYGITKSRTQLSDFTSLDHLLMTFCYLRRVIGRVRDNVAWYPVPESTQQILVIPVFVTEHLCGFRNSSSSNSNEKSIRKMMTVFL